MTEGISEVLGDKLQIRTITIDEIPEQPVQEESPAPEETAKAKAKTETKSELKNEVLMTFDATPIENNQNDIWEDDNE